MRNRATLLLLVLVLCHGACSMAMGFYREGEESGREDKGRGREMGGQREDWFLLHDSKHVVKTNAGEMRVIKSFGGRILYRPLYMGFITMEPKTLFVPQYLDSSLVLFILRGEAKIGLIYKDELTERRLKIGDIYRVPAGSTFYLVNTGEGQRLQIICSIDPSESLGLGAFQSFFVGGGTNPTSILSGFEPETLATAFNGSMMAPHVNPTATEYGIVLRGTGTIHIVFPNGTHAMNARVSEGDVFWVPRYFPFCQIASRSGPFEFFGFTTSARKNRPEFLVGASSILRTLRGHEIAASFGTSEDRVRRIIDAQREAVILPSAAASPPDEMMKKEAKSERLSKMMRIGNEMAMAFDYGTVLNFRCRGRAVMCLAVFFF
ncbi:hypothetical protein K2173_023573 [Erythroxylum novogranatense]|uniref:Cupin type-1 domain-containing protein n=1 Tax=Erythroxylum novogranatense TaxID=1862640 RepID=A0AAV8TRC5_9ROSI|nr:hypothetical protein K2173_023573 [Erythroxylum novogranatense]